MNKRKIAYPDYNNCLVNLTNSLAAYFEADCYHNTMVELDIMLKRYQFKNVVLLLNDGLGSRVLDRHLAEDSFLRRHKIKDITSVFPATTTAATTSVMSGLTPLEHCWLGWYLYVGEIDKTIVTFLNTIKDSEIPAADYLVAQTYFPYQSVFDNINAKGKHRAYYVLPFGDVPYPQNEPEKMYAQIATLCAQEGKKFIYAYDHNPDHLMHFLGTKHKRVKEKIAIINDSIEAMCESLTDTLVIVSADHGMLDVEYKFLSDYPLLKEMLVRETSIEPRAVNFFVKPDRKMDFEIAFRKQFGDDFMLLTREEIMEKQLFGNGIAHRRFASCLGDYMAIGMTNICIVDERRERPLLANHAGLTEDEIIVPLIAINRK